MAHDRVTQYSFELLSKTDFGQRMLVAISLINTLPPRPVSADFAEAVTYLIDAIFDGERAEIAAKLDRYLRPQPPAAP